MRYLFVLIVTVLATTTVSAQRVSSFTLIYSKERTKGQKIQTVKGAEHALDAKAAIRRPDTYFAREFTFDQKKYTMIYKKMGEWKLFHADTLVASGSKTFQVNGIEYEIKHPDPVTIDYFRNGFNVLSVNVTETKRYEVHVTIFRDQQVEQEALNVLSSYYGLVTVEGRRSHKKGIWWAAGMGAFLGGAIGSLFSPGP